MKIGGKQVTPIKYLIRADQAQKGKIESAIKRSSQTHEGHALAWVHPYHAHFHLYRNIHPRKTIEDITGPESHYRNFIAKVAARVKEAPFPLFIFIPELDISQVEQALTNVSPATEHIISISTPTTSPRPNLARGWESLRSALKTLNIKKLIVIGETGFVSKDGNLISGCTHQVVKKVAEQGTETQADTSLIFPACFQRA